MPNPNGVPTIEESHPDWTPEQVAKQRKKSRDKSIRNKIRKGSKRVEKGLELLHQKPIEEWDLDELAHGRPRRSDGTFKGPDPKWITPRQKEEARRRFQVMGRHQLGMHFDAAMRVIVELAEDTDVDDDGKPLTPASVRYNAATYIVDQVIGKATAKVEVEAGSNLRDLLAGALVLPGGKPATIIDGVVEQADEDDEDDALAD